MGLNQPGSRQKPDEIGVKPNVTHPVVKSAFKPGSLARLKSGGVTMAVNFVESSDCHCVWQTSDGEPRSAIYHEDALIPILSIAP